MKNKEIVTVFHNEMEVGKLRWDDIVLSISICAFMG